MITDKVGGSSAKPEVSKQSKEKRLKHKVSGYKSQSKQRSIAGCRLLLRTLGVTTQGKLLSSQWPKGQKMATTLSLITEHLLRAPIVARNPNVQVVITHTSHVGSQHSFEIPLRMNGMHRTQFDHKGLDLLSLII